MTNSTHLSLQEQTPSASSITRLRSEFDGRVITPGDGGYDDARTTFYGGMVHQPAAIIRVKDAADVVRVVSMARDSGLELAVRSGGHSMAGHSLSDGGIVLDLSKMKTLQIDLKGHTAWAETGLTAGEYTAAAAAHGLATGFGDTATVGIGGLTVGGGAGHLVRKYGLTIDQLLAAEIVTADGNLLHVDCRSHPDLFWAIRGGGGNFGVVTRFQYQVHELDMVMGGMLVLPAQPEVIADFIAQAETAPDELTTIVNVMTAPPLPFLPKELYGKPIMMSALTYAGDVKAGEEVVKPFRALAKPLADMLRPMRYLDLFPHEENGSRPIAAVRTMFIDNFDRSKAKIILDHLRASSGSMAVVQLRVLGGAVARVPVDSTAYAHRKSRIMLTVYKVYEKLDEKQIHEAWVANAAADLKQNDNGAYVNFLGNEGENRVRAAYPGPTWNRLAAIKERYDPTNLFHRNQNIPPLIHTQRMTLAADTQVLANW